MEASEVRMKCLELATSYTEGSLKDNLAQAKIYEEYAKEAPELRLNILEYARHCCASIEADRVVKCAKEIEDYVLAP